MAKICTSIEQSKKLIELGIDITTADMYYYTVNGDLYKTPNIIESEDDLYVDEKSIPACSLSALLQLMPPYLFEFERGIDLTIYPNLNGKGWHCSYMPNTIENMKNDKFRQITNGNDSIDAAFEMIVWLKENKKI